MTRSMSTFSVAILLFLAFLATFISAAPADIERRHGLVTTDTTNTNNTSTDSTPTNSTTSSTDNVSGSLATTMNGQATYYDTGLGACGYTDTDNDFIVALSEADWDNGAHCNKQLRITDIANGKSCTATVRDMCPGCASGSLDLSPAVFKSMDSNLDDGVFRISWYYL